MTNFSEYWNSLSHAVIRKLNQPAPPKTPLPTPADIVGALPENWMAESLATYADRFGALMDAAKLSRAGMLVTDQGLPVVIISADAATTSSHGPLGESIGVNLADALLSLHATMDQCERDPDLMRDYLTDKKTVNHLVSGLEAVYALWESCDPARQEGIKDPIAALIAGYLDPPIEPDQRETAIIPNSARVGWVEVVQSERGTLFDLDVWTPTPEELGSQINEQTQAFLPNLVPDPGALVSTLPLYLYDGAGGTSYQRGGGAAPELRLWVEFATAVPIEKRYREQKIEFSLWEARDWLWPDGWNRTRQFPRLRQAMIKVDQMRLIVNLPSGGRTAWRVVGFLGMFPPDARLDDKAVAQINLPPGSGHGPLVHKPTLRQLGVQSAPQYRGALGMAYHWWDQAVNGRYILPYRKKLLTNPQGMALKKTGEIIRDNNGDPIKRLITGAGGRRKPHPDLVWVNDKGKLVPYEHATLEKNPAAWGLNGKKGYPIIKDNDLIQLFHSGVVKGVNRRVRLTRARSELEKMAKNDLCVIEEIDGGYRIMPPQWWGPR